MNKKYISPSLIDGTNFERLRPPLLLVSDGTAEEVERKAGDEEAGGGGEDFQVPILRPRQVGGVQNGASEAQARDIDVPRLQRELPEPH